MVLHIRNVYAEIRKVSSYISNQNTEWQSVSTIEESLETFILGANLFNRQLTFMLLFMKAYIMLI